MTQPNTISAPSADTLDSWRHTLNRMKAHVQGLLETTNNIGTAVDLEEDIERLEAMQSFLNPQSSPAVTLPDRSGRHHDLKTDSVVFEQSTLGLKPWEIRRNDREFVTGDTVTLQETRYTGAEMANGFPLEYTGRERRGAIGFVLEGPVYGLADDWCVFTLLPEESN